MDTAQQNFHLEAFSCHLWHRNVVSTSIDKNKFENKWIAFTKNLYKNLEFI